MAKPSRYTPEMAARYKLQGYWGPETPSGLWRQNAEKFPDRVAVVDSGTRLTWYEANQWIDRLALGFIDLGIKKDELVVLQLPNSVELCLLRVACERAGIICLPVLRTWRHHDLEYALARTRAVGVVIPWVLREFDHFDMIQALRPRLPDLRHVFVIGDKIPDRAVSIKTMLASPREKDPPEGYPQKTECPPDEFSLVMPTTGTTGFPKFVEEPICSFMCREKACVRNLKITDQDVLGALTPTAGGSNSRVYHATLLAAARMVMLEHFTPQKALEVIDKEKITLTPLVPAQLVMMIRHPDFAAYDMGSLRFILAMGAPLPFELAMEIEAKMGCPIVQNYSGIDCSAACMGSIEDPPEVRFRAIGKPYAGAEVKLLDDDGKEVGRGDTGEIFLRGPGAVSGYFGDPEATRQAWTEDGWFRMGDLGRFDERGNLSIVGRKKDLIIRGGQNIYPVELENLLGTHPCVSQVAVVKMPDPVLGERACAYVVVKENAAFSFEEMIRFLKDRGVAVFKLPERLEIVGALPMVAEGQKVNKKQLEQDIKAKLDGLVKSPKKAFYEKF
ncbi:MAG: AMP-binding protein [Desulfobacterales bacterium]|nr:AMP-binding protein [Desulfobacterales bacterium]